MPLISQLPPHAEPYAWPGGYPIGYLCDDGEYLCAPCANDPSNPVHTGGERDGWRIEGYTVFEGSALDYDGPVYCAHCWSVLVADDDDNDDDTQAAIGREELRIAASLDNMEGAL